MTVRIVHGFNVRDNGKGTTDKLVPYFRGAGQETKEYDYGWRWLLGVRFCNPETAALIAKETQPGDIGVGHSNGGLILKQAADLGAPFKGLVLIHPALENDCAFAPQLEWIHVYHGEPDQAVRAAQLLDILPWNWFAKHPWGDMGAVGYSGTDARVTNYDDKMSHSGNFKDIETWGPLIVGRAT